MCKNEQKRKVHWDASVDGIDKDIGKVWLNCAHRSVEECYVYGIMNGEALYFVGAKNTAIRQKPTGEPVIGVRS